MGKISNCKILRARENCEIRKTATLHFAFVLVKLKLHIAVTVSNEVSIVLQNSHIIYIIRDIIHSL